LGGVLLFSCPTEFSLPPSDPLPAAVYSQQPELQKERFPPGFFIRLFF
jgi:hypothetical protein